MRMVWPSGLGTAHVWGGRGRDRAKRHGIGRSGPVKLTQERIPGRGDRVSPSSAAAWGDAGVCCFPVATIKQPAVLVYRHRLTDRKWLIRTIKYRRIVDYVSKIFLDAIQLRLSTDSHTYRVCSRFKQNLFIVVFMHLPLLSNEELHSFGWRTVDLIIIIIIITRSPGRYL